MARITRTRCETCQPTDGRWRAGSIRMTMRDETLTNRVRAYTYRRQRRPVRLFSCIFFGLRFALQRFLCMAFFCMARGGARGRTGRVVQGTHQDQAQPFRFRLPLSDVSARGGSWRFCSCLFASYMHKAALCPTAVYSVFPTGAYPRMSHV